MTSPIRTLILWLFAPRAYIAGPMRGCPGLNWAAFDAEAKRLKTIGYWPINPAQMDRRVGLTPEMVTDVVVKKCFLRDLRVLTRRWRRPRAMSMIPRWECSEGACLEWLVARALRLDVLNDSIGGIKEDQYAITESTPR